MHDPIAELVELLARLPGIGEKSAMRLALAIVRADAEYKTVLSQTIDAVRTTIQSCSVCRDLSPTPERSICADARRDRSTICVIAHPQDPPHAHCDANHVCGQVAGIPRRCVSLR